MSEKTVVLNIAKNFTIDKEVDEFRQYLYARQLYLEAAKKAIKIKVINIHDESDLIYKALRSFRGDEQ